MSELVTQWEPRFSSKVELRIRLTLRFMLEIKLVVKAVEIIIVPRSTFFHYRFSFSFQNKASRLLFEAST